MPYGCFPAIVGHNRQLHLTFLNIKHWRQTASLARRLFVSSEKRQFSCPRRSWQEMYIKTSAQAGNHQQDAQDRENTQAVSRRNLEAQGRESGK
jgi:hypothetical protein